MGCLNQWAHAFVSDLINEIALLLYSEHDYSLKNLKICFIQCQKQFNFIAKYLYLDNSNLNVFGVTFLILFNCIHTSNTMWSGGLKHNCDWISLRKNLQCEMSTNSQDHLHSENKARQWHTRKSLWPICTLFLEMCEQCTLQDTLQ